MATKRAVKAVKRVRGRFPQKTSIVAMLDPKEARALSPRARALTKTDLVAMWKGKPTESATGLTVADVNSVRAAFSAQLSTKLPAGLEAAGDINCCCCCCPCCCAETVHKPIVAASQPEPNL